MPGWLQYRIKGLLPPAVQDQLLFRWYTGGQRWEGWRAFSIPNNDSVGAIRISVKGRDRVGLVAPGEEYRQVCQEIADALYELTDPVTGRSVVRRVTVTHEEFQGPFLDQLPDLTVLWDQLRHRADGVVDGRCAGPVQSGRTAAFTPTSSAISLTLLP
jgi:hypothetical protein